MSKRIYSLILIAFLSLTYVSSYQIQAFEGSGETFIPEAFEIIVPVPKNVTVPTTNSSGDYTIQWSGGEGGEIGFQGKNENTNSALAPECPGTCVQNYIYTLEESKNGSDFKTIYVGRYKAFFVGGRATGTYAYRLKAAELQNNVYVYSEYTETYITTIVRKYNAPVSITVPTTTVTNESITISWASHSNATYYTLEERVNGGAWNALTNGGVPNITATSFTRSNPNNGRYQYRVNTCTDLACGDRWRTSIEVFVYWPRNDVQGTLWIPIIVGDITTFIPHVPSGQFSGPQNLNIEHQSVGQVLSWDPISLASKYEVQGLNSSGQWVTIMVTEYSSVLIDSQFDGYSSFRVKACSYISCTNTGGWSVDVKLKTRTIIYIHTDLLGSPAAETDINGDVQ